MCIIVNMMQVQHLRGATGQGALVVLCGGVSAEHDVSLASARSVITAIADRCHVRPIVIDREGRALSERDSRERLGLSAVDGAAGGPPRPLTALALAPDEVVFPLLHGPFGEDGSVQGWLRLMGATYVGSGVHASAVGMDKLSMKAVLAAHGLAQVAYRGVRWSDHRSDPDATLATLDTLGYPLFVKPANLGSSLGIHRVTDRNELRAALDDAFGYDHRVIVEAAVEGVRELEVAVLGNETPRSSPVGEIRYTSAFYDYEAKYTPGSAELLIPAALDADLAERARAMALRAFQAIDAAGLARVDLFLDERTGTLYLNEINTMPGFTATSMYPRLWAAAGIDYPDLIAMLVALARERRDGGSGG